jgi:hypothetical protein
MRVSDELLLGAIKTMGIPNVILVAERDQVSITKPNSTFEIGSKAQVAFIFENPDGIGSCSRELLNDGYGSVH